MSTRCTISKVDVLNNIQIVMVNTTLPANIGSAARAMHTMGLKHLTVVDPKLPIDADSISHAAGAVDLLNNTKVVSSLEDALKDSSLVFAASSRSRSMPRPLINPNQAAAILTDFIQRQLAKVQNQSLQVQSTNDNDKQLPMVSILFGREDRGLTNEELAKASYHIQIDANPHYPVLNVASAVQVISSFIQAYLCNDDNLSMDKKINKNSDNSNAQTLKDNIDNKKKLEHIIRVDWDEPAITNQQAELLNDKIIELMTELALADSDDLRLLPSRLQRMTSRVQLDKKEFEIIMSILSKINKRIS